MKLQGFEIVGFFNLPAHKKLTHFSIMISWLPSIVLFHHIHTVVIYRGYIHNEGQKFKLNIHTKLKYMQYQYSSKHIPPPPPHPLGNVVSLCHPDWMALTGTCKYTHTIENVQEY